VGATDSIYACIPNDSDVFYCRLISNVNVGILDTVVSHNITLFVTSRADSTYIQTLDTVYTCYNTSPELTVLTPTLLIPHPKHRWYDTQTSDYILHEGSIYFPPSLTTSRSYFVSVYDSTGTVCENDTNKRKEIKVIVYDTLVAGIIGSPYDICVTMFPSIIQELSPRTGGSDSITHQWQVSNDSLLWSDISSATTRDYLPSSLSSGTHYFRRVDADNECDTVYTAGVKVIVYDEPILNTEITGQKSVCLDSSVTLSNATPGGVWTSNNDKVTISNPTANPVTVTGVISGHTYITYTLYNGLCEVKQTFLLKVLPATTPTLIIGIEKND
jgi:hypothetical protein